MSDKSIATQSQLNAIYFQLNDLAENLAAHANAPLGFAHGFNFLHPVSFVDVYQNTINGYLDSHDDQVGEYVVVVNYAGVRYFCPAKTTALAGQPAMSGLPASLVAHLSAVSGASSANWVTDFAVTLASYVSSMNAQYLLPHARYGYWEAHRNVTVTSRAWTDDAGHVVGDSSVLIAVGGRVYEIPAKMSLKGTVKYWSNFELSADYSSRTQSTLTWNKNVYFNAADNSGNESSPGQFAYFWFTERNSTGTLPRAIRVLVNESQYGNSDNWLVMPPSTLVDPGFTVSSVKFHHIKTLFNTFNGGTSMAMAEYPTLPCVNGTCNSVATTPFMFTFNNDEGGNPIFVRVMSIAYAQGTADEKKYSFGNLVTFRNEDTDGGACSGPDNNVSLSWEDPFNLGYTAGEILNAHPIGTTIPDDVAPANLLWVNDDPLKPA